MLFASLVATLLAMIIVPMPAWLLDIFLTANVMIAIAILPASFFISKRLKPASFPTILVIFTLFRLALNISTTRLILTQGYAGEVVSAFGSFAVGEKYVGSGVGFLFFTILVFIIIIWLAKHVSKIVAHSTLDSKAGKFYDSMNNAMKFIKGDAIACMIIILINIVAGFMIGIVQRGLDFESALRLYSLLTIGAGVAQQIPALIVAVSASIVVTRSARQKIS